VVVVGNIVAGGAGKTPLTLWLAQRLRAAGRRPGIVSRGYGRAGEEIRKVGAGMTASEAGDEPLLLARRAGCPVFVGADRVAAARALLAEHPECDLVLCDDGLQHVRLARDVEFAVFDGRGAGNGWLLPAGPLREPVPALPAFALLVHGRAAAPGEIALHLQLGELRSLDGRRRLPLAAFAGRRVRAVAGIGDPERFFAALRAHGLEVEPQPFPDHHAYRAADFAALQGLPLLMTGKDAEAEEQLRQARLHNEVTGLPNRAAFLDQLDTTLRRPAPDAPA